MTNFTKIIEIESNNEKKIWNLTFTNFITTRNDAIEKTFEKMLNEIEHDYLLSFVSFSSKNENISNDFDIVSKVSTSTSSSSTFEEITRVFASSSNKTKKSKHWEKTTTINENNILFEEISRNRKSNSLRNFNHYVVLKNVFVEKIRSFYETFATSMQKKKRSHRNDFLIKFKFYHQMLKHSKVVDFFRIIDVEIKALQSKQIWKKMFWSHVKKTEKIFIFITWIFKYKFDNDDYLMKHKTRLCVRENFQQTKQDVYVVTLIIKIFRAFMIIIIVFDLNTRQYDAINAFANNDIDELIYCKSFDDWKNTFNVLFFLLKTLYDLKQSSTLWYKHLSTTLNKLKLKQMLNIECLFTCDYMIFFFVNDIAVMYYSQYFKQIDVFEQKFFEIYEMKNIEKVEWFFNIRITRDKKHQMTFLYQNNYVDKFINKFNIDMIKKTFESSIVNYIFMIKNENITISQKIYAYQQRVDFINFAIVIIRSNVIVAVFKLTKYFTNFSKYHIKQTNRTLKYLTHIKNYVIVYNDQTNNENIIFIDFFDVSFVDDINIRQSSNEYCFKLFDDLIDWKIFKQKTIIINFIEIEFMIMSMTINTKMWWNRFFETINMKMKEFTHIECDNRQTIRVFITSNVKLIIKLHHVDIHRHWLRQKI